MGNPTPEYRRWIQEFEAGLPQNLRVKRGPVERRFNITGYQIRRDGVLVWIPYTDAQQDILNWGVELGLCDLTGIHPSQNFIMDTVLQLSWSTGDQKDFLHPFHVHVTTKLDFLLT